MEIEEWEAWLENPITRKVLQLLKDKGDAYLEAKREHNPIGAEAHEYLAKAVYLAVKAESYHSIHDSLSVDAFEDIFEVKE